VLVSHTMTVLSSDADASLLLSGENCTAVALSEWPYSSILGESRRDFRI
jgi:hypothetical protein